MIPGPIVKEGSFEDCVYQTMQGGMKLEDAIRECAKLIRPPDLAGSGLTVLDILGESRLGNEFAGVQLSDCYGEWNHNAPIQHSDAYAQAKGSAIEWAMAKSLRDQLFYDWIAAKDPDVKRNLTQAQSKMSAIALKAGDQYASIEPFLTDEEKAELRHFMRDWDLEGWKPSPPSPPGDWVPPDDDTAVARPATEGQSLCQRVSEFIGECNRDGWQSPDCKVFLDKLNGCLDRTVADPADPAEPCSIEPVDPEKAEEVFLLHCWGLRNPVPGEDPCTRTISGLAMEYKIRTGGGGLDPCDDPYVRHTGEDCYPTFTLVKFGEVDINELQKWGLEKLGGPVFIIPKPAPDPSDDPVPPAPQD
ncbi:MAG: hypothetical protein L0Z51_04270 [Candidatus Latescibacteria bacterium]|nr:hypothetical protein [Candidatus Latescibacterota bacterium]